MVDMRDMADVLRAAGVPVTEEPGWQSRGTGGSFNAQSIMLHHDASPPGSSSGSADYIIDNLLSQLWLSYNGTWHVIAAGRMNHAGKGSWPGVTTDNANATFIGIETDHTTNEIWTEDQRYYGIRGLIALADWLDIRDNPDELYRNLIGHKEWAPDRKVDPDPLNMNDLRELILNPPYDPEHEEDLVKTISKGNSNDQTLEAGKWKTLRLTSAASSDTGLYAVGPGPARWFNLSVHLSAVANPKAQFQVRAFREDGDDDRTSSYSVERLHALGNDGRVQLGYQVQGSIPEHEWLRFEMWCSEDAVVESVTTQCALW